MEAKRAVGQWSAESGSSASSGRDPQLKLTESPSGGAPEPPTEHVQVGFTPSEAELLEEALRLTDQTDPAQLLKLALKELVERQRFRRWVDLYESR